MTWATLSGVLPVILSAAKDLCAPRACLSSRTPGCHPGRPVVILGVRLSSWAQRRISAPGEPALSLLV